MDALLLQVGKIAGVLGLLVLVAAVGLRFTGTYHIGGLQIGTLLLAGVAGLAAGSFFLLWGMSVRRR